MKIKNEITVSVSRVNIISFLILLCYAVLFILPYFLIWGKEFTHILISIYQTYFYSSLTLNVIVAMLVIVLSILLHELIHGLVFALFAKNKFKDIGFGFQWVNCIAYCHCKTPLKNKYYLLGVIAPLIILGIIPSIIALINGNILLLALGMFLTIAACGDIVIASLLVRENMNAYIEDHPNKIGCYIYV